MIGCGRTLTLLLTQVYLLIDLYSGSEVYFASDRTCAGNYLYNNTPQYRLYDQIFNGYNSKLRPRYHPDDVVEVGLEFELNTVSGLDEVNQVMTTVGFVVALWYDDFLCWNETEFDGLRHFVVPASTVWLPDIGLKNSADQFYDISYSRDFRVDIRSDGRILWSFGGTFETTCVLDMTYYPFDLQRCDVDIENWSYTNESVHLYTLTEDVHLQEYEQNGQWQLDHTEATVEYFYEDTHPGKAFPRALFSLFITRKFVYYIINIVTPALFVISISLTVFWLPPDSGEKVSLGITVLLAFSVFQLIIVENTPRTSDFTPVMTKMFTSVMGMSTFSVITSIIVLYFHHHINDKRPPKLVRILFFKFFARILCMAANVPNENRVIPLVDETNGPAMSSTKHDDVMVHDKVEHEYNPHDVIKVRPVSPDHHSTASDSTNINEIVRHLRKMTYNVDQKERNALILEEWRGIALVLDRLFFWTAFITIGVLVPWFMLRKDASHDHSR